MMARWMAKMLNFEASRPSAGAGEILRCLELREGDVVVDLGAGGGFFTLLFSSLVGNSGTVFAVDTRAECLDFIHRQASGKGLGNVRTVQAGAGPLELPEGGVDLIFLRNVFHHLADPVPFLARLKMFLKPAGKVAVIDHRPGAGRGFVRLFKHFTPEEDIVEAAQKAGYRLSERHDSLPYQSFQVFETLEK